MFRIHPPAKISKQAQEGHYSFQKLKGNWNMTQLGLRFLKHTSILSGEDNTQKPFEFSFCSLFFASVSSCSDVGVEWNGNATLIQAVFMNQVLQGIKIPKLLWLLRLWFVLSQGILRRRRGMETQQWIFHGMTILCLATQTGAALKYSKLNTSCSATKAHQHKSVPTS